MTATALLLIDLQHAFAMRTAAGVPRSNPGAEAAIARLVSQARARGVAVMHVHHDDPNPASAFRADQPGGQPLPCAAPLPGEPVFFKTGSSGFSGTGLSTALQDIRITRLIVAGAAIDYCVSSTVRAASDLGFAVDLVADAVFGFSATGPDGAVHDPDIVLSVTLAALGADFARLVTADTVVWPAASA
ncbi:MAG: isochorismatase family protein [Alphaproteobacteria bacterium]|nr:isochorismatase family protein [Alphaproteobacteria bacterium]